MSGANLFVVRWFVVTALSLFLTKRVIGYGVLNYTFYQNGCIDMLYIHSDYRQRGVGTALLRPLDG